MRSSQVVAESPHYVIQRVVCVDDHAGWSAPELTRAPQIVLVRRGCFRLDSRGRRVLADPTTGYLHGPGEEKRFSHSAGGDVCTAITFSGGELVSGLWPESPRPSPALRVDARLELAHRLLLRTAPDPERAAEAVLDLLALALRGGPDATPGPGRGALAERAREAILADAPQSGDLVSLARLLDASPSHLSRTFRHHTGTPLSRYRNRVRVSRALSRIEDGETDLAGLALDLGFSDQPHFTRVMREELGHTPSRVRALLTAGARPRP
ncbi:helix-turn-helix domain-containing protein [Spirillospora sp. CA-294931]|uniref:helix-turn-helix domain-containing protein n=1 Tax=Spirillospora sp. CA-294931 TaxID=3240042 RepID=UPI003D8F37B4